MFVQPPIRGGKTFLRHLRRGIKPSLTINPVYLRRESVLPWLPGSCRSCSRLRL